MKTVVKSSQLEPAQFEDHEIRDVEAEFRPGERVLGSRFPGTVLRSCVEIRTNRIVYQVQWDAGWTTWNYGFCFQRPD